MCCPRNTSLDILDMYKEIQEYKSFSCYAAQNVSVLLVLCSLVSDWSTENITVTYFLETLISMDVRALATTKQQNKKVSAPLEVFKKIASTFCWINILQWV